MKSSIITFLLCATASSIPIYDPRTVRFCETTNRSLTTSPFLKPDSPRFNQALYNDLSGAFISRDCGAILAATSKTTPTLPIFVPPPKTTPTSPISVVPAPKATIPNVITGPGVCSVYLAKIKALPPPTRPSAEYTFYYNILDQNNCRPLPLRPFGVGGRGYFESQECAFNRAEIFKVDPNGERYREIYQVLVERHCQYLPPAPTIPKDAPPPLAPISSACEVIFKEFAGNPDPKSQTYLTLYMAAVRNSCSPLPAFPQ